jgi:O-antigen ligase
MFKNKKFIVYLSAILFILTNALFVINNNYFFNALPFVLVIVFMALFSLDKLLYLIIFLTPLSIPISELVPGISNDISLPVEPLLFGVLLILIFKLIFEKSFDKRILYHPVSIAIYINLFWILITSLTSTMPIVSLKFFIARLWFLASYYFLATHLFNDKKNIYRFLWLYISSFLIVIFYTLYQHSKYGFFDQEAANFVVSPFLPDHTSYAAIIAMLIPFVIGVFSLYRIPKIQKTWIFMALTILIVGLVFSYTRAAWVSLAGAFGIYLIMLFKIKFKVVFVTALAILSLFLAFQTQIFMMLEKNEQESDDNFTSHIESMSNISTDASNLERLNRWSCAYRMFKD